MPRSAASASAAAASRRTGTGNAGGCGRQLASSGTMSSAHSSTKRAPRRRSSAPPTASNRCGSGSVRRAARCTSAASARRSSAASALSAVMPPRTSCSSSREKSNGRISAIARRTNSTDANGSGSSRNPCGVTSGASEASAIHVKRRRSSPLGATTRAHDVEHERRGEGAEHQQQHRVLDAVQVHPQDGEDRQRRQRARHVLEHEKEGRQ